MQTAVKATMYTIIGIKPGGEQSQPLQYPTLKQAMQKLQDLIEADEMEVQGGQDAMFARYAVVPKLSAPPPRTSEPQKHSLRLVR